MSAVHAHLLRPLDFVMVFTRTKTTDSESVFLCGHCGSRLVGWLSLRKHPCVKANLGETTLAKCMPHGLSQTTGKHGYYHPEVSETGRRYLLNLGVGWSERAPEKGEHQCVVCGIVAQLRNLKSHAKTHAVRISPPLSPPTSSSAFYFCFS